MELDRRGSRPVDVMAWPGWRRGARAAAGHHRYHGGGKDRHLRGRAPLEGKIIGIDPGHNGRNYTDRRSWITEWNGREWEGCDTTGTETASGYTEARFNWNVAMDLRADLIKLGARV